MKLGSVSSATLWTSRRVVDIAISMSTLRRASMSRSVDCRPCESSIRTFGVLDRQGIVATLTGPASPLRTRCMAASSSPTRPRTCLGFRKQAFARRRDADALAGSVDQLDAKLAFQRQQVLRDGALGFAQPLPGGRQRSLLDDREEGFKMPQMDTRSRNGRFRCCVRQEPG